MTSSKEIILKKYDMGTLSVIADVFGYSDESPEYMVTSNTGKKVRFAELDEAIEYAESYEHSWRNHTQVAHRVEILKFMHEYILGQIPDENAYMSWIYTMPDEPDEDDFVEIALDDESWKECVDKFNSLVNRFE